jgi:threonine/homoserine/homoserine lactone efflux protein
MILDSSQALFLAEVFGVLAMPGPTNSLLFVSGATRGLRASLSLPFAELTAYLISLSMLLLVVGPAAKGHTTVGQLLRVLCSMYLAQMAVWLWRSGTPLVDAGHPITFPRVFLTTLVNPKNLLFAFVIFPAPQVGFSTMLPCWAGFAAICAAAGYGWVAAGALLHSTGTPKMHMSWVYRGEACVLVGFAIAILISAYYSS